METADLTIEILKSIRDEVRQTNARLDQTNLRLEHLEIASTSTNVRLDSLKDELSRRIVASEVRTATAIAELADTMRDMTAVLRASHDLRPRVDRCERDISDIKQRLGVA